MPEQFIGEIRIMSWGVVPNGWAPCNGQLMPINSNQALFSLLGTAFGGDGRTTFGLPNLRVRVPLGLGTSTLGTAGGEPNHTLSGGEMPQHTHALAGATGGNGTANPSAAFLGPANNLYHAPGGSKPMSPTSVTTVGGGLPHENMQPYLALSFCIALIGEFPSRN